MKSKHPHKNLKIGDWVDAKAHYESVREYKTGNKFLIREEKSIRGQIVGAVYRYEGEYNKGYSSRTDYFTGESDFDPPSLSPTKTFFLWKVATSILGKHFECTDEDVVKLGHMDDLKTVCMLRHINQSVPMRPKQPEWDERSRNFMKKEMKNWPRDNKGRWIKG